MEHSSKEYCENWVCTIAEAVGGAEVVVGCTEGRGKLEEAAAAGVASGARGVFFGGIAKRWWLR